jgi:predicted ATPase/transcriptional regulator with XRE-family HTH domain
MDPESENAFGEELRRHRTLAGLSQEELAERAGLTVSAVSQLERGARRRPKPRTVRALAEALGLAPADHAALLDRARDGSPTTPGPAAIALPGLTPAVLPATLTSFVGRERELTAAAMFVSQRSRLLTLTGPGGVGKTRLAIEAARSLARHFPDGVWFVDLAPLPSAGSALRGDLGVPADLTLRGDLGVPADLKGGSPQTFTSAGSVGGSPQTFNDPALVPQAVAAVLGVRESTGRSFTDGLIAALRDRTALVVVDNCEHLLDACAALASTLLRACPTLTLLATSREALGVTGEQVYPVPPLTLPPVTEGTGSWPGGPTNEAAPDPSSAAPDVERLREYPTVALFVERARAVRPDFHLTAANALEVVRVCRRLDGLPLAIELAAARVRVLSPEQIAARLDDRFRLVAAGARDTLPRHQTLRALIDWSYDLLGAEEQVLLRRLAVFVGGWTLDAAEAIGAGEGIDAADVLDLLTALVDKSLVVVEQEDGGHYQLLETIRAYVLERLVAAGEEGDARSKHLAYFARLALTAEPRMEWGPEQLTWLRRIERERDNLHAAIAWATTNGDPAAGQQMVKALWRFWWHRGLIAQGRRCLDWALSLPTDHSLRAKLLQLAGQLAYWGGEMTTARAYLEDALTLYRARDDTAEIAWTLHRLGVTAAEQGEPERGLALSEESIALCRTLDDERGLAYALQTAGNVARMGGAGDDPEMYAEEALALCRASGNQLLTPYPLRQLMVVALTRGDDARARALGEEALALAREIEDPHAITAILTDFLRLARRQRDLEETEMHGREGLSVLRQIGDNQFSEAMLEMMAWAVAERGQPVRAVLLLGAASALRGSSGASRDVLDRSTYDETLATTRGALGDERFTAAWARGQSLALNAAISEALSPISTSPRETRGDVAR